MGSTERGRVCHGLVVLLCFGVLSPRTLGFTCYMWRCLQEVYYGFRFIRCYSVKVFKWVIVAVVITEEKLKGCVIRIPI